MSRRGGVVFAILLLLSSVSWADDHALWREYGLESTTKTKQGKLDITTYRMKDLTGALAAWEWLRSPQGRSCDLAAFCTQDGNRTIISDYNYVLVFEDAKPSKSEVSAAIAALPNKRETSLPAILTFLPREGMVPDSARYVLGSASLDMFAADLSASKPGFDEGAEAQVAEYKVKKSDKPLHLAVFYYPAPEMARMHTAAFKRVPGTYARRSGVLVAVVYGNPSEEDADTLLSRVQYEAKITWNDVPPPSPIKPLFQLLWNIIYLSIVLAAICLVAGLMYAGMRIYRRRYGTLESEEAMTTLRLTGGQ
jgi:hypothetical protein